MVYFWNLVIGIIRLVGYNYLFANLFSLKLAVVIGMKPESGKYKNTCSAIDQS